MTIQGFVFAALRVARSVAGGKQGRGWSRVPAIGPALRNLYGRVKPRGVVTTTFRGFRLTVDADDPTHEALLLGMDFNDPEFALVESYVSEGMVAVDVGANVGCFSLVLSSLVGPTGSVVAFEPGPENAATLRANIETNGARCVRVLEEAVSDASGTASLELASACGENRLVAGDSARTVPVSVTTLDEALTPSGLRADFVKLDAQGAEFAVLRGMKQTLDANPRLRMLVEFDPDGLRAYGESPTQFAESLESFGFDLFHVRHDLPLRSPLVPLAARDAETICRAEGRHINLWCVRSRSTNP